LQHAGNPVDWYAWKPEAFERAVKEDKPILVSIGYSTCHWCHVMERESFENKEVASFMNEHFINIKVDREERPDVDHIYMEACQAISGSGGWPLNCFLTPDGRPFYAGTYYPPRPAYNRPSWMQLLEHILSVFREKRQTVEDQADQLTRIIQGADSIFISDAIAEKDRGKVFTPRLPESIFENLRNNFDSEEGGFGGAPKFPGAMSLKFLLDYYFYSGNQEACDHVLFSLEKMIRGGIYDQLGGGFARYATDRAWLVPHFEKMLYDNALLVSLLADAYRLTRNDLFRETIEETLAFVQREMTGPEGGFYSALDADSEGEEGKFYVWSKPQIDEVLGHDSALFCDFYGVTEGGNWEGKNILHRSRSLEEFAEGKKMPANDLKALFHKCRETLFQKRAGRIRPGLDDKIILGWNALQCSAYAQAYAAVQNEAYREAAMRNIRFLLDRFAQPNGQGLYHTFKEGRAQYEAFLDDYAFLIAALIDVYEITFQTEFLRIADRYTTYVMENFLDPEQKMFYFTSEKQHDLILRKKDMYDSAVPAGNSTMAHNLQRLGILVGNERYRELGVHMLSRVAEAVVKYPSSFARWAGALTYQAFPPFEIAVTGERAIEAASGINAWFLPNKVIMASSVEENSFPLLAGKGVRSDTNIYVCKDYSCQMPVKTLEEARKMLHLKNLPS
jgi:uncharacterized protein